LNKYSSCFSPLASGHKPSATCSQEFELHGKLKKV
jgi:hypothetical protein